MYDLIYIKNKNRAFRHFSRGTESSLENYSNY
jgi:hypothetical protein